MIILTIENLYILSIFFEQGLLTYYLMKTFEVFYEYTLYLYGGNCVSDFPFRA